MRKLTQKKRVSSFKYIIVQLSTAKTDSTLEMVYDLSVMLSFIATCTANFYNFSLLIIICYTKLVKFH